MVGSQLADPVGAAGLDEAELRSWLVDHMRRNLGELTLFLLILFAINPGSHMAGLGS